MKIIYMGTPAFAVPALQALAEKGVDIPLVVTQPDRPKDRGKKLQSPPVKEAALALGLPVEQPEKLRGQVEFFERLRSLEPDLIVVAAYGKLLPTEILEIPKYGCVNLHASLLPKYRGAAPIQRAVLAGEEETGITLMYMSQGMDEGDMIATAKTPIEKKTAGTLFGELAELSAALLCEHLAELTSGNVLGEAQDSRLATYAPMIAKQEGQADFQRSAVELERLIRAMDPWPTAYTYYHGEPMKLLAGEAKAQSGTENTVPGQILDASEAGIEIATGDGTLLVTRIQMPGKKPMEVSSYLKGNQIDIGGILGYDNR